MNCINGFFAGSCDLLWRKVVVPQPATYTFTLLTCIDGMSIEVLGPDGTTVLATSPTATSASCGSVAYHFAQAGTYFMNAAKHYDGGGCDVTGLAGDFTMRTATSN